MNDFFNKKQYTLIESDRVELVRCALDLISIFNMPVGPSSEFVEQKELNQVENETYKSALRFLGAEFIKGCSKTEKHETLEITKESNVE